MRDIIEPMSNSDDGCDGCSRRSMLQGLVAASALVPIACRLDDPEAPGALADAGNDGPPVDPGFAMCGANMCVDLSNPMNAGLLNVGGSRVIPVPGDKILVVRTDAASFDTLSGVCTHAGCTVRYVVGSMSFLCPCHGSSYSLDGMVTGGPALRALTPYTNTFDEGAMMLTIML
jgi:Rieske Fe-S protein